MGKRIYLDEWLKLKPYNKQVVTDAYYLQLSNKIKDILIKYHWNVLTKYFGIKIFNPLSCFIASYFEDIISGTNIWTSFIELHQKYYNKRLPYYDVGEYYEGEINEQDIRFLLWYFLNSIQDDKFFNSNNPFIFNVSEDIFKILEQEYEYAPENNDLKKYYEIDENESNYYNVRKLLNNIFFGTYLFYPDTILDLEKQQQQIINDFKHKELEPKILNEHKDTFIINNYTRLMSLPAKEWASKIVGEGHPLSKELLQISRKISGFFFYKGQDEKDIFLEHIATGKRFAITKKSIDHPGDFSEIDSIFHIGIVRWKGEWWFSGIYYKKEFDAGLILDEKNSLKKRIPVFLIDAEREAIKKALQSHFKAFLNFTGGKQIVFMPSKELEGFIKDFVKYFNNSLGLSKKEEEEAKKRTREKGLLKKDNEVFQDFEKENEIALVFFNPEKGIEIAFFIHNAFPLPHNKYYNEKESNQHVAKLLFDEGRSKELVNYCIDNCKKNLPFFNSTEGKLILEELDFLLRFWKKNYYHTTPEMSIL